MSHDPFANNPGPFNNPNPYAPPTSQSSPFGGPVSSADPATFKLLQDFRSQMHALGGIWIFFGVVVVALCIFLSLAASGAIGANKLPEVLEGVFIVLFAGLSLLWFTVGVLTCQKIMPAVYVGLVLSYLSVIGNLLRFNICGLVIVGAIIVQAHRVISFATKLKALGIPLTTKPNELQAVARMPQNY